MERFHLERDGSRIFIREAPLPFVNEEGFFPSLFLRAFESRSLLIDDRMGGFDGQVAVQVQGHAVLGHEVVGEQLTLTLDEHQAALLEAEAERLEDLAGLVRDLDSRFPRLFRDRKLGEQYRREIPHLDAAHLPGALHPGRDVHGVPPYVVVRLPGPDHPSRDGAVIDAHLEYEVVETLLVDARQRFLQLEGELDQGRQVAPSRRLLGLRRLGYPGRRHVRRPYRLYLDDVLELVLIQDLETRKKKRKRIFLKARNEGRFSKAIFAHRVEIGYDLVQESETLEALVVDALLAVEIGKVGHAGE